MGWALQVPGGGSTARGRRVLFLVGMLLTASCSLSSPHLLPPGETPPVEDSAPLKVHLQSGGLVVLEAWEEEVETRRLVGWGRRYDRDREPIGETGRIAIPVDSVALLEVTRARLDGGYTAGLTLLAAYTVLTAAVTGLCIGDPKACFGSCPTFYLDEEDGEERLVAEGFSSSIARVLEATDVDDIRRTAGEGRLSLRMRNEALETHAVRSLRLHAVPELRGQRVLATTDGRFFAGERIRAPQACTAPEGECLAEVRALDGRERFSPTDSTDLGARETIELEFVAPERSEGRRIGLALAARHSFVSTFLFYQMLAYLGRDAGAFLASVERGEAGLPNQVREVLELPGRIEVEVMDADGGWRSAGAFAEAGPLATDIQVLELAPLEGGRPLRVRLNLTRGFWRLEHVGLVSMGEEVESTAVSPVSVERLEGEAPRGSAGTEAPGSLEALLDPNRYLVTNPGDHFRIWFELPQLPAGDDAGYRLFLESTGYYYEWMRAEWLEDESPERAALMLQRPEWMFRVLAPAFKELEAGMEDAFWNSRFRR